MAVALFRNSFTTPIQHHHLNSEEILKSSNRRKDMQLEKPKHIFTISLGLYDRQDITYCLFVDSFMFWLKSAIFSDKIQFISWWKYSRKYEVYFLGKLDWFDLFDHFTLRLGKTCEPWNHTFLSQARSICNYITAK